MITTDGITTLEHALAIAAQHAQEEKADWLVVTTKPDAAGQYSFGICPATVRPNPDAWDINFVVGVMRSGLALPDAHPLSRAAHAVNNALQSAVNVLDLPDMEREDVIKALHSIETQLAGAVAAVEVSARETARALLVSRLSDSEYDALRGAVSHMPDHLEKGKEIAQRAINRLRGG